MSFLIILILISTINAQSFSTYSGGPTLDVTITKDDMTLSVSFPSSFPADRYLRIGMGYYSHYDCSLDQGGDSWVFYPDRDLDGQVGDIIDVHRVSGACNFARDTTEHITGKAVSQTAVTGTRLIDTLDASQDTVYDCKRQQQWYW